MRSILAGALLVFVLAGPAWAGGEWRGGEQGFTGERPLLYAKGCYWRRGTRHCSQYCYVEINGRHYCNQRESEAFPQGDPYRQERPTVEEIYRRPRASH